MVTPFNLPTTTFDTDSSCFSFVDGTSEGPLITAQSIFGSGALSVETRPVSGSHLQQQQSKPLRKAHNDLAIFFSTANARKVWNLVAVKGMGEGAGF